MAKADTWVAALGLWFGGLTVANDQLVLGVVITLVGVVFLIASGDYVWRKGFVAGKRNGNT